MSRYAVDHDPASLEIYRDELDQVDIEVWALLGLDLLDAGTVDQAVIGTWARRWVAQAVAEQRADAPDWPHLEDGLGEKPRPAAPDSWDASRAEARAAIATMGDLAGELRAALLNLPLAAHAELVAVDAQFLPWMLVAHTIVGGRDGGPEREIPSYAVQHLGEGPFGRTLDELVAIAERVRALASDDGGGRRDSWETAQIRALAYMHKTITSRVVEVLPAGRNATVQVKGDVLDLLRRRDLRLASYRFIRHLAPLLNITCPLRDTDIMRRLKEK